ncbi:trypsin-like peptidase domain-containing protein [Vagococcus sp. BWB3-3]|uniref:Trypsin-like peptidase domain-containing protein n=1 Tax=Vagococcus allomyrinae TaxID=2794353 RepID=A0A940P786_9ENTE|nr:trypsin-like peptidase domain-containing protein [Vagococcus allomyrinae]MBP1042682.1 trypsin-like peptidase domain-containing protein [Vagococcus allomyrinae]
MRKDVTPYSPKKQSSGFIKGIAGGVLGGLLTCGVALMLYNPATPKEDLTTSNTTNSTANTAQISNIKYDVESDTTKAVEKVEQAVVSVVNLQKQQSTQSMGGLGGLFGQSEQQPEDNADSADGSDLEASSEGSGVIYKKDGKKAYIVTNNHVVEGSDGLEVILSDGTKVDATLVGSDVYTDLAVLEIDSENVKATAEFGDSDAVKLGEPAIAIGSPLGSLYANSVTQGIISGKDRNITSQNDSGQTIQINAIQTDAAINPGNSGGPLVNAAGQVIGINSIKIASATSGVSAEGMGFSIPSNDVVEIINQLEANKKVSRPMLGVKMSDLSAISSEQQEKILKIPTDLTGGVIIREVEPASPAEKAGLKQYDVIVAIDDKEVETGTDLQSVLYKKKVGDSVKITFYRESDKKTTTVELTLDAENVKSTQKNLDQ